MVGIKGGIKSGSGQKEGKQETGKWGNRSNGKDGLDNNEAEANTAGDGVTVVDDEEDEVAAALQLYIFLVINLS